MPEEQRVVIEAALTDDQRRSLGALAASPEAALPALAKVALDEWLGWLIADDRPASLTEISKRRTKALIGAGLLPSTPTAALIAQRLRLTLGQARYVVTALALESPAMSEAARAGLVQALTESLADAGTVDPLGLDDAAIARLRANAPIEFDAPRAAGELAAATHEEILNEEFSRAARFDIEDFRPPVIKRQTDSFVHVAVRPHVAVRIIQRLADAARP
jgi:hypothetical protein